MPLVLLVAGGASQQACSCDGAESSAFDDGTQPADGGGDDADPGSTFNPGTPDDSGSGTLAQGTLTLDPPTSTINVAVTNGVASPNPATTKYTAKVAGIPISKSVVWYIDRGEIGAVASDGTFTPSNKASGEATIHAKYGDREATAKILVNTTTTQIGRPADVLEAALKENDPGGAGGVGGELIGTGTVGDGDRAKLLGAADGTDATFKATYPYDKTVWPRKIAAPVIMWDAAADAKAVYLHIKQSNFELSGFYSYDGVTVNPGSRKRIRIPQQAWKEFTNANAGDDVTVEVKILGVDDKVYGPIKETWKIAPGILAGTIYYNSYDSLITGGSKTNCGPGGNKPCEMGGVLSINSREPQPKLAVASQNGKCHTCHTVSADGSRLFAQDGKRDNSPYDPIVDNTNGGGTCDQHNHDYANGASYKLTEATPTRTEYRSVLPDAGVVNAKNDRKFAWSAPYPDGSFALASYGYTLETWLDGTNSSVAETPFGQSRLFSSADGADVDSNVATVARAMVTPAFSPDGRKVAFDNWRTPDQTNKHGRELAVLDFACGAAQGAVACTGAKTFSNLRTVYKVPDAEAYAFLGWPSFVPDGSAVLFQKKVGPACDSADGNSNCESASGLASGGPKEYGVNYRYHNTMTTWYRTKSELWWAQDKVGGAALPLNALMGRDVNGVSYLPVHNSPGTTNVNAATYDDTLLNYMPTVNPVPSGGYFWAVFTSRRRYGNLLTADPFASADTACAPDRLGSNLKKLWVAAIDINTGMVDPSHPGFYLPGQELDAGNSRGYWVVDPCKADGNACETGDECCGGFCRPTDPNKPDGPRTCQAKPPASCSQEFEKCTVTADCCAATPQLDCIGGRCGRRIPK